jgi:hypothetical protein
VSDAKLDITAGKVGAAIAKKCTPTILTALGYRSDCQYGAATPGVGGTCAALPVTTATEFATCMECWKGAEFSRFVATLYASHANEVCIALDNTSPACSALGCASPLPDQRDLGDNAEGDCQRFIAKAGINYLLKREKIIEKCLLKLGSLPTCLADLNVQLQLSKAETQKETLIKKNCGNRDPVASPPFCCKTTGNQCVAAASRDDCTMNLSGSVQEGKLCGMGGTCENPPGNAKGITWWEHCPTNSPCPGPTLGNIDGVVDCVDDVADGVVGNVLCLQFPNGGTCATPVPTPTSTP